MTRGLDKVSLLPSNSGYLELGGEWAPATGLVGYGELGYRFGIPITTFVRGEYGGNGGSKVFGGLRYTF